ncbi:MAG: hypothetical protein RBT69_04955 [Spirochaetia bacterium]|jgi:predicted amidophosphoribosyltransferase|nr:hypothetical protein [Spirochaetia bacterium]
MDNENEGIMEYIVIIFLLILIIALAGLKFGQVNKSQTENKAIDTREDEKPSKFCPICGSPLKKGETVKSRVYPSGGVDSLMDVYGCPRCIPPGGREKRICPVCKKVLPKDGYVIGRYFVSPGKKRHLHVLGCTLCRKG